MPRHDFHCAIHGDFEITVAVGTGVPKSLPCPVDVPGPEPVGPLDAKSPPATLQCGEDSPWMPPKVAAVFNWSR